MARESRTCQSTPKLAWPAALHSFIHFVCHNIRFQLANTRHCPAMNQGTKASQGVRAHMAVKFADDARAMPQVVAPQSKTAGGGFPVLRQGTGMHKPTDNKPQSSNSRPSSRFRRIAQPPRCIAQSPWCFSRAHYDMSVDTLVRSFSWRATQAGRTHPRRHRHRPSAIIAPGSVSTPQRLSAC